MDHQAEHRRAIAYLRSKVDQMLRLIGTLPLRPEELDDGTLIDLDPIGIITESFGQVLGHLKATNQALDLAKQEIRAIFDSLSAAVVVLNQDGTIDDCNLQAREWLFDNGDDGSWHGRPLQEVCACSDTARQSLAGSKAELELWLHDRHLQVTVSDILDAEQKQLKKVFICFDITRQKNVEASLRLYAKVFGSAAEGIAITDPQSRYMQINDAFCRITGYAAGELLGRTPRLHASGHHDEEFFAAQQRELERDGHWQGEVIERAKEGHLIPLLQTISLVRDDKGQIAHYVIVVADISSLKETQTRLDFLAHHDPLTELPNRLLFTARLQFAIERAREDSGSFGLLFIDLDRFKTINDSLGHQVGDRLLIAVARRLRQLVRHTDTIGRLGGDEFVVLLEQLRTSRDATTLAQDIVTAMRQPFLLDGHELHLGCSIGLTLYPDDGTDAITLLKNADTAMYGVKDSGRDGYRRFSPALSKAADRKLRLEGALRQAVRSSALTVHYQPIVDLRQQRIIAVEALMRWPDPQLGTVPPGQFIPVAEDTKLILPLGRWLAEEALSQFARWRAEGLALDYVAINASGSELFHPEFAEMLAGLLARLDIEGHHLQIELTEDVLMRDIDTCQEILGHLREQGIRIAIDDFGTGYSSLAHLKQLPIDDLKIDRTFVGLIPDDADACAITEAIIGLANTLGLEVVAEGVETVEQERFLTGIGCSRVQGYHYAEPAMAADFEAFQRGFGQR